MENGIIKTHEESKQKKYKIRILSEAETDSGSFFQACTHLIPDLNLFERFTQQETHIKKGITKEKQFEIPTTALDEDFLTVTELQFVANDIVLQADTQEKRISQLGIANFKTEKLEEKLRAIEDMHNRESITPSAFCSVDCRII
ncbi:hypothetical protein SteCoe_25388 [Stentor coeruleus]|uniref:Uncharacterized protein n=1 Tax=Stentor coeruleus TaxID=5963 RepID=A0A1R2BFB1_9CILI|nr:hypothetical protein SteCoe_25388 [Stentor coeruleus]